MVGAGPLGWTGGTGTTGHVDSVSGTVGVLLTERAMIGPWTGSTTCERRRPDRRGTP